MYTEKQIINALKRLKKNWNPNYWLFVAGETYLMKKDSLGNRMTYPNGGMSREAIITSFNLDADGGDW